LASIVVAIAINRMDYVYTPYQYKAHFKALFKNLNFFST